MPFIESDGVAFHYREAGAGRPFVFQHGLGGDVTQPFGLVRPPAGWRMIAFDFRAHGETRPLGDPAKIGIAAFADDLAAVLDRLDIARAVIGGISMGAAVSLNFALRHPARTRALVLARPAWQEGRPNGNLAVFGDVARLIRAHGAARALEEFRKTAAWAAMLKANPDGAQSLAAQFLHPRAEETVAKYERIPADDPLPPGRRPSEIRVPALVLANRQDPVHPFESGEVLAAAIPGAVFREITPKAVSVARHAEDMQVHIEAFLAGLAVLDGR